jgi:hypothetical protein
MRPQPPLGFLCDESNSNTTTQYFSDTKAWCGVRAEPAEDMDLSFIPVLGVVLFGVSVTVSDALRTECVWFGWLWTA